MGGALSSPITTLYIERQHSAFMRTAVAYMQGWRTDMEDAHNICLKLNEQNLMLFGVYDGHGGKKCAEYLGQQVVGALKGVESLTEYDRITKCMLKLDADFLATGNTDGSTCTIVLAQPWNKTTDVAIINNDESYDILADADACIKVLSVNVGDSRSMIIRKDGSYVEMTEDHKPENPIERKRIVAAGGHVAANRVDGNLAVSRAFGDSTYKNPNLAPENQKVIVIPEFKTDYLYAGDSLLITCDGVFEADSMTYEKVAEITHASNLSLDATKPDPALVCRDVIAASLVAESRDNHTAMFVTFAKGDIMTEYKEKDIVPGSYIDHADNPSFNKAYIADLAENGYTLDDVRATIDELHAGNKVTSVPMITAPVAERGNEAGGAPLDPMMMQHILQMLYSQQEHDQDE